MEYPRSFVETVSHRDFLGDGLHVVRGLNHSLAAQLPMKSKQDHIRQFCPNDGQKRFRNLDAVREWQAKGRLSLPLVTMAHSGLRLQGFGWIGPGAPDDDAPQIPGAITTFAIRLYRDVLGQKMALPYAEAMLNAHSDFAGSNDGVWLEAWSDNSAAIKTYERAGFETVAEAPGMRAGQACTRLYMQLG